MKKKPVDYYYCTIVLVMKTSNLNRDCVLMNVQGAEFRYRCHCIQYLGRGVFFECRFLQ